MVFVHQSLVAVKLVYTNSDMNHSVSVVMKWRHEFMYTYQLRTFAVFCETYLIKLLEVVVYCSRFTVVDH